MTGFLRPMIRLYQEKSLDRGSESDQQDRFIYLTQPVLRRDRERKAVIVTFPDKTAERDVRRLIYTVDLHASARCGGGSSTNTFCAFKIACDHMFQRDEEKAFPLRHNTRSF